MVARASATLSPTYTSRRSAMRSGSRPCAAHASRYQSSCRRVSASVVPGLPSHASPRRAARSMAGCADAPIQTSIGSGGSGAIRVARHGPVPVRTVHGLPGPQCPDDRQRLLELRRLAPVPDAHRGELSPAPADRALQDERPLRDARERRRLLGDQHRVPQRQEVQRPGLPRAPLRQHAAEDRRVLVVRRRRRVVVADEQRVQPRRVGRPRPFDHVARAGADIVHPVCARHGDTDSHPATLEFRAEAPHATGSDGRHRTAHQALALEDEVAPHGVAGPHPGNPVTVGGPHLSVRNRVPGAPERLRLGRFAGFAPELASAEDEAAHVMAVRAVMEPQMGGGTQLPAADPDLLEDLAAGALLRGLPGLDPASRRVDLAGAVTALLADEEYLGAPLHEHEGRRTRAPADGDERHGRGSIAVLADPLPRTSGQAASPVNRTRVPARPGKPAGTRFSYRMSAMSRQPQRSA